MQREWPRAVLCLLNADNIVNSTPGAGFRSAVNCIFHFSWQQGIKPRWNLMEPAPSCHLRAGGGEEYTMVSLSGSNATVSIRVSSCTSKSTRVRLYFLCSGSQLLVTSTQRKLAFIQSTFSLSNGISISEIDSNMYFLCSTI